MSGSEGMVKRRGKTIVFDKFYGAGVAGRGELVARRAKNCDFEGGALQCGFGSIKYRPDFDIEREIATGASIYGNPKLVFTVLVDSTTLGKVVRTIGVQTKIDRIFIYDPDSDVVKHVYMPKTLLRALNYTYPAGGTKAIFCCEDLLLFYDLVNKNTKIMTDTLTGACLYHERLFVSTKDAVKYTVPTEVSNFEADFYGGGEIKFQDLRGEIVWLETLGEEVFVFMQYGIARISAPGVGNEFRVYDIPYGGGHIIPRTICVYEQKLVFAAYDGIYVFDGKKCSKIQDFRYAPLKNLNLKAGAGCSDNRYFLYYLDEEGQERSLAVDLENRRNTCEYYLLHGVNQSGGKALCATDYVYSYLDRKGNLAKGEAYTFESDLQDFGSTEEKSLKYVTLYGTGVCTVIVKGMFGEKMIRIDLGDMSVNGGGTSAMKRFRVGLRGREFSFEFTLQKGCVIEKMAVEYDELGGVK